MSRKFGSQKRAEQPRINSQWVANTYGSGQVVNRLRAKQVGRYSEETQVGTMNGTNTRMTNRRNMESFSRKLSVLRRHSAGSPRGGQFKGKGG